MTRYINYSERSGVACYELYNDGITVQFMDGGIYSYTYSSASPAIAETMKQLAVQGVGLNSFINRHAKYLYVR